MIRKLKIWGLKWIDWTNLNNEETLKILNKYDFHELDVEACLEENQRARIDSYPDYLFMVLHFPKYNKDTKMYILNEFNIFLWRDFLITFRNEAWNHIDSIFEKYSDKKLKKDEDFKLTSAFVLYEIIQSMLEKMFKVWDSIRKDLKQIERIVFEKTDYSLVKHIMIKKRNIVVLKHMFVPQISVMKLIELNINKLFAWKIEEYFEDLEDKIEHVVNDIKILEEYTNSIEDAFKSIIDIKTNRVMAFLAFFSAFMLPLTLITSFYWMNIKLPFQNDPYFVFILFSVVSLSMVFIYFYFRRRDNI
jgi:magnesium transporter